MKKINAVITFSSQTSEYILSELKKYVNKVTNGQVGINVTEDASADNVLVLGLLDELLLDTHDLKDPFIEDIVDINVKNGVGHIAGSNPRSVLIALYKYFYFAGCRFLRPGDDGEYIPYCDLLNFECTYRKKADSNFRGECSEGAASYEHYRDVVYWLPKVGGNMFMIEGFVPYTYMHKWYGHIGNTALREKGQVTDYDFLAEKIALLEKDIQRTGLQFHNLGHDWMFLKFGINKKHDVLPPESYQYLALLNGKREIKKDLFYTQLCYSNPEVRKRLCDFVIEYLEKKPYIDYLHLWLADSKNNDCECEECVKMHPSDWYVVLLNDIEKRMAERGIKTRLVFIQYVETVRPPQKMRLNHPDKFTLLTAIGVDYTEGYKKEKYDGEIPVYVRNDYKGFPSRLCLDWTEEWLKIHGGMPSMVFEYRFYIDHYNDAGYMRIAKETYRDMKRIREMGFSGNMSDQTPRNFLPTSLPMIVQMQTLFDLDTDYEALTNDYFTSAFGADGQKCREYLENISELFSPHLIRRGGWVPVEDVGTANVDKLNDTWQNNPEYVEKLKKIPPLIDKFLPTVDKNTELENECHALSWKYLKYHAHITRGISEVLAVAALDDIESAQQKFNKLIDEISLYEFEIHRVFDLFLFNRHFRAKLMLDPIPYYD